MKVTRETFTILQSHLQPNGFLSIPALARFMQEAAWANVKAIGVSTEMLFKKDMAWVLTRMQWKLSGKAIHRQQVTIETWPSGSDKYYFYRDFRAYVDNKLIATITSTWILISLSKRQLMAVPDFLSKLTFTHQKQIMERATGKITLLKDAAIKKNVYVSWHHLDINQHTNNTCYLQWIIESLPIETLKSKFLTWLDVIFKLESILGDQLTINSSKHAQDEYIHSITNHDNKELVRAMSKWA